MLIFSINILGHQKNQSSILSSFWCQGLRHWLQLWLPENCGAWRGCFCPCPLSGLFSQWPSSLYSKQNSKPLVIAWSWPPAPHWPWECVSLLPASYPWPSWLHGGPLAIASVELRGRRLGSALSLAMTSFVLSWFLSHFFFFFLCSFSVFSVHPPTHRIKDSICEVLIKCGVLLHRTGTK